MSSGLNFGSLPTFADLSPDQQAAVIQRMLAQFGAGDQPAPLSAPAGLLGQADPQTTGAIPVQGGQPVAMNETQTQAMERQHASPTDMAALGGSPVDRLLFDRAGLGGGPNGFTGSTGGSIPQAEGMGVRPVPMPPTRPSEADLLAPAAAPVATGSLPVLPQGQTVASSKSVPGPGPNQYLPATPADRAVEPTGGRPLAGDFDPLTGQPISGSPRPLGAPQGAVSPSGAAAATGSATGRDPQPGVFERFAQGLNNPDMSNLLLNVGMGLMSQRGFGPGVTAGLQGYQQSQAASIKNLLEQVKLQQTLQGQQATYGSLRKAGFSHEQATAGMYNPTMLSNLLQQQTRAPTTVDLDGSRYLVPMGAGSDPAQWQKIGSVNGPQLGFEPDPNNPGSQRPITGGSADPTYKGSVAGAEARAKNAETPDKPIQVRPGGTLIDPNTMKPVFTAPGNKPEGFETEDKLRTEFSKQLGTFGQVHDGYGRVIAATKQREANPGTVSPASDIGLIFGYMKMLDPGSVVREGEYATAKNATGVPERVLNAYNKALNGEFLSDAQRKDFLGQAAELYGTARKTADGVAERYRGLAQQYGVSPDRSVYLPDLPTPPKIGQQSQAPQGSGAAARYQALIQGGMSKADAFAQMHKEGL